MDYREVVAVIPEQLLVDRHLSKSAKLLWAFWRLGLGRRRSGLCRDTYRDGMAQLRSGGWLSHRSCGSGDPPFLSHAGMGIRRNGGSWASIPGDLLLDRRVGTQARLLYALLQFTPGFSRCSGQFTFTQLCTRTGLSRNGLKAAVAGLVDSGWLVLTRTTKYAPICFTLNRSAFAVREKEVAHALSEYENAPSKGEGVMQALLSGVVASRDYVRNARPGFLVNPETGCELELDRYYLPHVGDVAFEFQGLQHDQTTKQFPDPVKLQERQRHDRCKAEICAQRGIHLVLVRDEDLSLDGIRRKVAGLLPLADLDGKRQLVEVLKGLCSEHRSRVMLQPLIPLCKSS